MSSFIQRPLQYICRVNEHFSKSLCTCEYCLKIDLKNSYKTASWSCQHRETLRHFPPYDGNLTHKCRGQGRLKAFPTCSHSHIQQRHWSRSAQLPLPKQHTWNTHYTLRFWVFFLFCFVFFNWVALCKTHTKAPFPDAPIFIATQEQIANMGKNKGDQFSQGSPGFWALCPVSHQSSTAPLICPGPSWASQFCHFFCFII